MSSEKNFYLIVNSLNAANCILVKSVYRYKELITYKVLHCISVYRMERCNPGILIDPDDMGWWTTLLSFYSFQYYYLHSYADIALSPTLPQSGQQSSQLFAIQWGSLQNIKKWNKYVHIAFFVLPFCSKLCSRQCAIYPKA